MNIAKNNMAVVMVDFSVSGMSLTKQDKARGAELNSEANAEAGTAKVIVKKFPESFSKPIINAGQKIYQHFDTVALRLGDGFAVPIAIYPKFKDTLDKLVQEFDLAVNALRDAVQTGTLDEISKVQQGALYDASNALTVADVDKKFGVRVVPYKNTGNPKIAAAMKILGEETVAAIEDSHKVAVAAAEKAAKEVGARRVVGNVVKMVSDIVERASQQDTKGVQWKTIVRRIQEAIETLPAYNVTGDAKVTEGVALIAEKLGEFKEYELKADADKRKALVTQAQEVASKFAGMFND